MSGGGRESKLGSLWRALSRKKDVNEGDESTRLHRCLGVCELTLMGIGGMVGSGIYFLVGQTAKKQAGTCLSVRIIWLKQTS